MSNIVGALYIILGCIDNASGAMDSAGQKMEQSTERTTEAIISKWTAVGLAITGAAFTAGLAVDAYNAKTARVEAANLRTKTSFDEISNGLQNMGDRYHNVADLAGITDQISRLGPTTAENLLEATNAVDELAGSIKQPGDAVASSLLPALEAFDIGVGGISGKVDGLSYLFNNSSLDIQEWGSAMSRTAPLAAQLGLTLDDMDAALLILAERGYSGRSMISALNDAINTASTAASNAQDKFDQASDKVQTLTDRMSLLSDTSVDLSSRLGDAKDNLADLNSQLDQGANIDDYRDKLTKLQDTGLSLTDRLADTAATIEDLKAKIAAKQGGGSGEDLKNGVSDERFSNAAVDGSTDSLAKLQRELTKTEHEYTQIQHSIDQNNKAQKEAADIISSGTTPEYERLQKQQKSAQEQVDSLTKDIAKNNDQMVDTKAKLADATTEQGTYAQALKDAANPQATFLDQLKITDDELKTHKQLLADSTGYAAKLEDIYNKLTPTGTQSKNLAENAATGAVGPAADVQNNTGLLSGVLVAGSALSAVSVAIDLYKLLGGGAGKAATAIGGAGAAAAEAAPEMMGLSAALDATAASQAAQMAAISAADSPMAAAIEAQSAFEALGTTAATSGAMAGTTLAAGIGAGVLGGLVVVRGMVDTGLLSWISGMGQSISKDHPLITDAAKILFAPIGLVGAAAIDVATLQFGKIPGDLSSVAGQTGAAAGEILKAITGTLSGAGSIFLEAGGNIAKNISDGILGGVTKITGAISSVLTAARAYLPFSPAKTGPLAIIPKWEALLSEPITAAMPAAMAAMQKLSSSLSDSLTVQPASVSPDVSSGASRGGDTYYHAGDRMSINNPVLQKTQDVDALFQQFERWQTGKVRQSGYRFSA